HGLTCRRAGASDPGCPRPCLGVSTRPTAPWTVVAAGARSQVRVPLGLSAMGRRGASATAAGGLADGRLEVAEAATEINGRPVFGLPKPLSTRQCQHDSGPLRRAVRRRLVGPR